MPSKKRILLVEDKDDPHVVSSLLNSINIHVTRRGLSDRGALLELVGSNASTIELTVKIAAGVHDLIQTLPVECKASDLDAIAVIVDADTDFNARWNELKLKLEYVNCHDIPKTIPPGGLVARIHEGPRIGIWIMPDNCSNGMLEDMLLKLIPDDDKVLPLIRDFIHSIPNEDRPFSDAHLSKVIIHSWLAMRNKPGLPFGQAITCKHLNSTSAGCQDFIDWLNKVLVAEDDCPSEPASHLLPPNDPATQS